MVDSVFAKQIIRKVFLEDWGLKLIALVITLALWFGVTGLSTPTTKRFTIPLNLNISSSAQIVNAPLQEVEIEVNGDKRKVEQINRTELAASLDLTDVEPGDRVILLSPESVFVPLPQGVKLVEVAPSRIAVNLEAVEEKDLEVKTITTGEPAPGYEVYSTTVLPPNVKVRGPASIVRILEYVQTDKINLTGKKDEFTAKQVPVVAPNPKAAVLNTFVDVIFKIGEKRIERSFSIPVADAPRKTVNFTIYGPRTSLSKVRVDDFKVEFDGETPRIIVPDELQNVVEVKNVKVRTGSSSDRIP
ncbi:MAG: YbbR-like domain-containing protein [Chloracidobacterium sp.]|nr:YbbR-like domain-containing protein [Chloracidobacterium sp.]